MAVALLASLALATGAAAQNVKHIKIAVSAVPWTVIGSTLKLTGTATPHPAGLDLTLQRWYGSGWLNARADGFQRRKIGRQTLNAQLNDVNGIPQVLKFVFAQVHQCRLVGQLIFDQRTCRL